MYLYLYGIHSEHEIKAKLVFTEISPQSWKLLENHPCPSHYLRDDERKLTRMSEFGKEWSFKKERQPTVQCSTMWSDKIRSKKCSAFNNGGRQWQHLPGKFHQWGGDRGRGGDSNHCFRSDQISRSVMSNSLRPHESQHARPPCPSSTPGVHSDSHPLSQWCHPAISSSVVPFSSCPQSLPASESFPMSQLFPWGGQSTGVSALASFLPKKSQGWSPSEWIGWISLQSKGVARVFSNTTVQKH